MLLGCCRPCGRGVRPAPAREGRNRSGRSSRDLLLQFAGAAPPLPAKIGGTTAYFFLRQHRLDHELGWGRKLYLASWPANAALWLSSLPEACRAEACPCGRARAVATAGGDLNRSSRARRTAKSGHGSWGGELGRRARYDAALRLAGPQRLVPRRRGAACTHLQPHCLPLALALAVALKAPAAPCRPETDLTTTRSPMLLHAAPWA